MSRTRLSYASPLLFLYATSLRWPSLALHTSPATVQATRPEETLAVQCAQARGVPQPRCEPSEPAISRGEVRPFETTRLLPDSPMRRNATIAENVPVGP